SCARSHGFSIYEQIRRRVSGEALLRRLRIRRRGREPRARPREAAFWRRARQRAAPRWIAGEHGGLRGRYSTWRYRSRLEPRTWRAPHARASSEFFRQDRSEEHT